MKNNRIIKISLAVIALIVLAILYFWFSVFVWGVHVAERELSKYAAEEITCEYDWYNDRYIATNDDNIYYLRDSHAINDKSFSRSESQKISADYGSIIQNATDNLTFPKNITVWTAISADDYNIKAQRLYLLGVWNTEDLSEAESLERPADIAMQVIEDLGEDYNFTGIQIIYYDRNGSFEIAFPAEEFAPITREKLLDNTERVDIDKPSESYRLWLEEKGFN